LPQLPPTTFWVVWRQMVPVPKAPDW